MIVPSACATFSRVKRHFPVRTNQPIAKNCSLSVSLKTVINSTRSWVYVDVRPHLFQAAWFDVTDLCDWRVEFRRLGPSARRPSGARGCRRAPGKTNSRRIASRPRSCDRLSGKPCRRCGALGNCLSTDALGKVCGEVTVPGAPTTVAPDRRLPLVIHSGDCAKASRRRAYSGGGRECHGFPGDGQSCRSGALGDRRDRCCP